MKQLATMALGFGIGAVTVFGAWCVGMYQGASMTYHADEATKAEVKEIVDRTESDVMSAVY